MHQGIDNQDNNNRTYCIYPEPRIRDMIDSIFKLYGNKPISYEILELRLIQQLDNAKIRSIDDIATIKKYTQKQYRGASNLITDLRKFIYCVDKSGFVHPRDLKQLKLPY